jgi:hypothetical protein
LPLDDVDGGDDSGYAGMSKRLFAACQRSDRRHFFVIKKESGLLRLVRNDVGFERLYFRIVSAPERVVLPLPTYNALTMCRKVTTFGFNRSSSRALFARRDSSPWRR